MDGSVGAVVERADSLITGLGLSSSTLWQYRLASSAFR